MPEGFDRSQYEIYFRYVRPGGQLWRPKANLPNGKTDLGSWHDLSANLYGMNRGWPGGNYAAREQIYDEHLYGSVGGVLPQLTGRKVVNEDGNGAHVIIPDLTENWRGKKFIRGYQIFPSGGIPEFTLVGKQLPGYGQEWKKLVRDYYTSGVSVGFQGEVLPYRDNRIEVDESIRDDACIPGVCFHYAWHENERAMFADMMEVGEEMLKAAGAEYLPIRGPKPMEYGHSIHYVGTPRMGQDPKSSVLSPWNQSHALSQHLRVLAASVLHAAIGIMNQPSGRAAFVQRHAQRLDRELGFRCPLQCPSNHQA